MITQPCTGQAPSIDCLATAGRPPKNVVRPTSVQTPKTRLVLLVCRCAPCAEEPEERAVHGSAGGQWSGEESVAAIGAYRGNQFQHAGGSAARNLEIGRAHV